MIAIVGAGLAGLSAAAHLTKSGYREFVVLERAPVSGGRVKSHYVDGFRLDVGFHIASTGYRVYRREVPAESLEPCWFESGVLLEGEEGGLKPFFHPIQHRDRWKTGFQALSPADTTRLGFLAARVVVAPDEALLHPTHHRSAREALQRWGFSEGAVDGFFRPFFGGVFLDNELETSAGLLYYYFKKFILGRAFLPAGGIQNVAEHLANRVPRTNLRFNTGVREVEMGGDGFRLPLASGEILKAKALILAAGAKQTAQLLGWPELEMRSTTTLYFRSDRPLYKAKCLVLPRARNPLVRHFVQLSNVDPSLAPAGQHLLSATLLREHGSSDSELFEGAIEEIMRVIPGASTLLEPLDCIRVPEALPVQTPKALQKRAERLHGLPKQLFVVGDLASNASQQNAVESGSVAAAKALATVQEAGS